MQMTLKRMSILLVVCGLFMAACSVAPTAPAVPENAVAPTNSGAAAEATAPAATADTGEGKPQPTTDTTTNAGAPVPTPPAANAQASVTANQPALLTGTFTYTNDIITTYYVENMVALVDEYGFVKRDLNWELPANSQVLGYLSLDPQAKKGTFTLDLPEQPRGMFVDVDNNGRQDKGVQMFTLAYWPNLASGPFSDAYDPSRGWASYLASTRNDSENNDEVIGGKLVVWAPDGSQQFPTGFGADGKLFTADDPVGPLPAGYSVVDLDQQPFALSRNAEEKLTLYEPKDAAIKDFSNLTYTQAFEQMFQEIKTNYAFKDIPNKAPNWDQLYQQLLPRVQQAQQNNNAQAFYDAIRDFTFAFHDGHVGLSGGQYAQQEFQQQAGAGYGFAVRKLDDGSFVVVYVTPNGPAAQAGMQVGATVTQFNNQPIAQAVSAVQPLAGPFSTDFAREYQQERYLTRAPQGTRASVTFANPNQQQPQTVQLTAVPETQSFGYTSLFRGADPNALPVEYQILDSGVGYVKVNSNYDDLNLIIRLFERALRTFEENQVPGIVIDMRQNSGGAPLELAGYLTNQTITMGQLEYYSSKTGKFEPEGVPEAVHPKPEQFKFNKMALLVNQSCYSACEIESYGFSKVPGMVVVGEYPTAGVEAEVSRGQFLLPGGLSLQVPTGRFVLPDGSIFLEGKGVQPTIKVPIDRSTVLSQNDVVLQRAVQAITGQ
jgi:C-terminal processing protease CtpA/Prc